MLLKLLRRALKVLGRGIKKHAIGRMWNVRHKETICQSTAALHVLFVESDEIGLEVKINEPKRRLSTLLDIYRAPTGVWNIKMCRYGSTSLGQVLHRPSTINIVKNSFANRYNLVIRPYFIAIPMKKWFLEGLQRLLVVAGRKNSGAYFSNETSLIVVHKLIFDNHARS